MGTVSNLLKMTSEKRKAAQDTYGWHLIMNHTSPSTLRLMTAPPRRMDLPAKMRSDTVPMHCSACTKGKMEREPQISKVDRPLPGHTIAVDIVGPLETDQHGFHYALVCVEIHTRATNVFLLKTWSQAEQCIIETFTKLARHFGHPATRIRCDNAKEFLTKMILKITAQWSIRMDPTCTRMPLQNGIAERLNKTLITRARATLEAAALPFAKYLP